MSFKQHLIAVQFDYTSLFTRPVCAIPVAKTFFAFFAYYGLGCFLNPAA